MVHLYAERMEVFAIETECILGMDIGGTNFRIGLVDRSLNCHHVQIYSSKLVYTAGDTPKAMAEIIRQYLMKYAAGRNVPALAIGFPSVVDAKRRRLLSSTNFPGLDGVDIVDALERELSKPVLIEHDAYYLLSYDIFDNGLENTGTMIGCYFGTGLGNAMYINGKPYIGKNGTACELGHLPIPGSDYPCSCGNRGCIEMFSCGKAFERIAQSCYPETPIGEIFVRHAGDQALLDFIEYMSVAIAAEVNILDPDYVFIGGGLVQMNGFPKDFLMRRVVDHARKPYPAENLQMIFSRPGPENGIIGAAIQGFEAI